MAPGNQEDEGNLTIGTKMQRCSSKGTLTSPPLPNLPFDLIAEILCMLPVKLLQQLRCLCSSFNSLISDPKFIKKHLRLSTKLRRYNLILGDLISREFVTYHSPITSFLSDSSLKQTQISYPPVTNTRHGPPLWVCSCDGILCFTTALGSALLWNPSIRTFKLLPTLKPLPKRAPLTLYSFGYDHFIDNYKVICITCNQVSVYTFGTNYWRRINDFPYSGIIIGCGVFLSGTVNWITHAWIAIYSLDLEKETYQKLPLPDLEKDTQTTLGVLKDCLCIYASSDLFLDVWVMKEYGNKESWNKLYNISYMGARF
jgi:F-box interacting protein